MLLALPAQDLFQNLRIDDSDAIVDLPSRLQFHVGTPVHMSKAGAGPGWPAVHRGGTNELGHCDAVSLIRNDRKRDSAPGHRTRSDVLRYLLIGRRCFSRPGVVTWGTRMSTASNSAVVALTVPITMAILAVMILHQQMTI